MHKINQIFKHHQQLTPLLAEADQRAWWQQCWLSVSPELARLSQVLAIENGVLVIAVSSGAVASRIKLLEQPLLQKLRERLQNSRKIKGLNLNAIKVKVQVKSMPVVRKKRIQAPSKQALSQLEQCAAQINNPALQQVLRQFIKHQRQR